MKSIYLLFLFLLGTSITFSQQDPSTTQSVQKLQDGDTVPNPWKIGLGFNLNASAIGLNNWEAGGDPIFNTQGIFRFYANYDKNKYSIRNRIDLGYGIAYLPNEDRFLWRKTDDQIILVHSQGLKIDKYWTIPTFGLRFQTQFDKGYDYNDDTGVTERELKTQFLAPGYLISDLGAQFEYENFFRFRISPLAYKMTIVIQDSLRDIEKFGNRAGETVRNELGVSFVLWARYQLFKNIVIETDFLAYMNYNTPSLIDINWETAFKFKVNNWLSFAITTNLIYDDDIIVTRDNGSFGPITQFKHTYALSISLLWDNQDDDNKK